MNTYQAALVEMSAVFDRLDDAAVDALAGELMAARRIVVAGCGRERLQVMGFAMRLFHLGLQVSVAGDMTTPAVEKGDLLLATCGPGYLATVQVLVEAAQAAGARAAVITAQPQGRTARQADIMLHLPAQTMADDRHPAATSLLPMGSLFEGALFVLFEVMVLKLKAQAGTTAEAMRANHTNLE